MSPPGDGGGPGVTSSEATSTQTVTDQSAPSTVECTPSVARALRTRRAASHRCAPLACGRRDPLDPLGDPGSSAFGLSTDELRAEANRLAALGWALDEVTARLAVVRRRAVVGVSR